jgi:hypothetical protein
MIPTRSAQESGRGSGGYRWRSHTRLGIILAIVAVVGAMITSVALCVRGATTERISLDGPPDTGKTTAIDLTIVLWVMVTLLISMLLYIAAWWRHLEPGAQAVAEDEQFASGVNSTRR